MEGVCVCVCMSESRSSEIFLNELISSYHKNPLRTRATQCFTTLEPAFYANVGVFVCVCKRVHDLMSAKKIGQRWELLINSPDSCLSINL